MKEYKFKETTTKHKNLVNFQFDVLGVKSGTSFYQRQCGQAKMLLCHYEYEDLLNVLKMFAETSLPNGYKSIYFLGRSTEMWIDIAKEYFKTHSNVTEVIKQNEVNSIKKKKIQLEMNI